MRIVVIGGTGRVGSKVVRMLTAHGHDAVAAAPPTGVNTVTGAGLAEVLDGTSIVIDVSNSPTYEGNAARRFFTTSTANLLDAEADAGVRHHIVLSVVGADRLADGSGYFRGKIDQEYLLAEGPIPYSVVRSTQFFEFLAAIAESGADGHRVCLPPAHIQPIACADVAEALVIATACDPVGGILEVAGPAPFRLDEIIRIAFVMSGDPREVVADPAARYWGVEVNDRTLMPSVNAVRFETRFDQWLLESLVGR